METTSNSVSFIHLQCHSEYSLVDGLLRMKPWLSKVSSFNMPAVAITDQCNLFGMIKFYKEALSAGVKPIIGSEVWIENELNTKEASKMILLCQNQKGYINLTKLISKSYLEGQSNEKPIIKKTWINEANQGIIALSCAQDGDIVRCLQFENQKTARILINYWLNVFQDRFYLSINRLNKTGENEKIKQIVDLAEITSCPIVATNAVCFLEKDDFEAHEARVCIHEGTILDDVSRKKKYNEEQYLKSSMQMEELFSDVPEAIENTFEIAKRCNLMLKFNKIFLPKYTSSRGIKTDELLNKTAKEGLEKRFDKILKNCPKEQIEEKKQLYNNRLEKELAVIDKMGFAGYFLIVADFVRWAHDNNIPVGPGRGSGAGSIVAYALKITALDPIQYGLLFERFLNPERVSMPDFDIDFCIEGRDRVIEYVSERYGKEAVSQIVTFGTMAAKAVIRDVGRVLGYPYGFVDQIAKLVPIEIGMNLDKALQQEEILSNRYKKEDDVKTLIDLAKKLEGITRNVGKHAAGVVIAPSDLTNYTPLYCEEGETQIITQFDMNDIASIGLIKFDFLGLKTLTIIDWSLQTINEQKKKRGEPLIELDEIPLDDRKPFDLLTEGKATAIFQLESRGARDLIKKIPPSCLEDIMVLVALNRPGPLQSGMVDDFINRKKGLAAVKYLHPKLEHVLQPTYGLILYQEQVMQIAQELAGYTLGAADVLRAAMGKKKPKEMAKQRKIFMKGALLNGIDKESAEYIFNLMEKFAGYGFNKSHSAAYALISYQTAWLKAHFPAEFMAAVLSADMSNTDKIVLFINECKILDLKVISPDINKSEYKFLATNNKEVIYGLGAIKSVGEAAIESILEARKGGTFIDLFDFCSRVDLRKITKRVLEALINAGAFDCFEVHRAALIGNVEYAIQFAEQIKNNMQIGQIDLFGSSVITNNSKNKQDMQKFPEWQESVRLSKEKSALGLYLSGHPIESYESELHKLNVYRIVDLKSKNHQISSFNQKKNTHKIAGFVTSIKTRPTKKGDRIAFVTLDDRTGQQEIVVFSDLLQKHRNLLKEDSFIIVEGIVSEDSYSGDCRFTVKEIMTLEEMRANFAKAININIDADSELTNKIIKTLYLTLKKHSHGTCPIFINYKVTDVEAKIRLGREWLFYPSTELIDEILKIDRNISAEVNYV